jgi:hypothetical protein
MDQEQIKQELAKFNFTNTAIEEISTKANSLVILGVNDKAGFDAVEELRKDVKSKRVDVEKKRKLLNEDALEWQRAVNAEAKRITALLEPIEEKLEEKSNWVKNEKARIKKEAEEAERLFIQGRKDKIFQAGGIFDGRSYGLGFLSISEEELKADTEEHFENFVSLIQEATDKKRAEEAEFARLKQAEAERIAKEQEERRLAQLAEEKPVTAPETPVVEVPEKINIPTIQPEPIPEPTPAPIMERRPDPFPVQRSLFGSKDPFAMDREMIMNFSSRLTSYTTPNVETEKARGIMEHAKRKLVELGQELQRML